MARKKRTLGAWNKAPSRHVHRSVEPKVNELLEASSSGEVLDISYQGGSAPGTSRQVLPKRVYFKEGYGLYLEAFCYRRRSDRSFRVDKINLLRGEKEFSRPHTPLSPVRYPAPSRERLLPQSTYESRKPNVIPQPRQNRDPPRDDSEGSPFWGLIKILFFIGILAAWLLGY